ncbi:MULTISPECIES: phosphonate C-P lyase system protein PhnH [Halomonas]|uniref:Alpha-D-ribose 1-methylphosphonate 5-triphosphate synthase subunit PhnH n=1 Tax=Halomonas ventosae TaxID=229007 RepID=A0A4R6HE48_9GAMM|nr:phosphonate C-P lyase system protein PhnH [Halomonas ventosae]TDO06055.1 alpha-D-ribose 1-methylphosphonate 5-triphosphate synthase subunit PhnH [Halomonas ventosae]
MDKIATLENSETMNASWPALSDPAHDSQRVFRQILGVLSEPGTLTTLALPAPPERALGAALWGVVLTLCDLETRVWIAADLDSPALRKALTFHTGARITDDPASADFALLTHESFDPQTPFALGSDSYPDRATTLLVAVERLENDSNGERNGQSGWRLSGPGIAESRDLDIGDSPGCRALMTRLADNLAHFPRGLDAILGCDAQLAAIPRSTCITRTDSQEMN